MREEAPGCLTNSPTADCLCPMIARSVDGSASQDARSREPAGVLVRSMVSRSEPSREPLEVANNSKFREEAASRRTEEQSLASIRRKRFLGRSQSESVT